MLPINISIGIEHPIPIGIPLPAGGVYKFIQHDDTAKDDKGQRIMAPEVYPLQIINYSALTDDWQWYNFRAGLVHPFTGFKTWDENQLTKNELDTLKGKWYSLMKGTEAFTNNVGVDEYHDYINENGKSGLPGQGPITCCGNIVRVIGSPRRIGEHYFTPIETLNGSMPPPPISVVNRLTRPDLIFCATNVPGVRVSGVKYPLIVASGINKGRIKVDPFPQLQDWGRDTLLPLRSNGNKVNRVYMRSGIYYAENYILTSRLVSFAESVVPIHYVH